jgi:ATP-binding cassette subfamily B protein
MRRFYDAARTRILSQTRAMIISGLVFNLSNTINSMRMIAGLAVGAYLFKRGDITIGTVYLVLHYLTMIGLPIINLMREFADLQRSSASILRIKELLDTTSKVVDGPGGGLPEGPLAAR